MGFIIGLVTFVMVLDCVVLILLVLIQLPKKEAGAGLAFGGGATDALFGAGSGNALTKITKYSAIIFFVLAIVLSVMQLSYHNRHTSTFQENLGKSRQTTGAMPPGNAVAPSKPASPAPAMTSAAPINVNSSSSTNIPLLSVPAETTNSSAP
jgi:preprotein translocase subunit SecG